MFVNKFGFRIGVGTTWEPLWPGASPYPFPTTAVAIEVVAGGNAADTAAGTGARTVRVYGLDANFEPISEDLTLAGALASAPSTQTFLRVNRARVLTAGSGEYNAAAVQIGQVGGSVLSVIPALYGQSQQAIYTIPAGWAALLSKAQFHVEGAKPADLRFVIRTGIDTASPVRRVTFVAFGVDGADHPNIQFVDPIPGPADVWLEAEGAATPDVSARFEGDLDRI